MRSVDERGSTTIARVIAIGALAVVVVSGIGAMTVGIDRGWLPDAEATRSVTAVVMMVAVIGTLVYLSRLERRYLDGQRHRIEDWLRAHGFGLEQPLAIATGPIGGDPRHPSERVAAVPPLPAVPFRDAQHARVVTGGARSGLRGRMSVFVYSVRRETVEGRRQNIWDEYTIVMADQLPAVATVELEPRTAARRGDAGVVVPGLGDVQSQFASLWKVTPGEGAGATPVLNDRVIARLIEAQGAAVALTLASGVVIAWARGRADDDWLDRASRLVEDVAVRL